MGQNGHHHSSLGERKYEIMIDGSLHLTTRNRRHPRRIPSPGAQLEEEEEDEQEEQELEPPTHTPVQIPDQGPEPTAVPALAPALAPVPASAPTSEAPAPRRSSRTQVTLDRHEVIGTEKSYADIIKMGLGGTLGKGDVSQSIMARDHMTRLTFPLSTPPQ